MPSYISENLKATCQSIIDNIHDTFARNITVFEEGEKVLISASPQYNSIYGRSSSGSQTTQKTVVKHTIKARIRYINAQKENLEDPEIKSQLDLELIDGSVRITVNPEGFEILKEAKRCEFEGRKYQISTKGSATGMFGPQYYHFLLKPLDE